MAEGGYDEELRMRDSTYKKREFMRGSTLTPIIIGFGLEILATQARTFSCNQ